MVLLFLMYVLLFGKSTWWYPELTVSLSSESALTSEMVRASLLAGLSNMFSKLWTPRYNFHSVHSIMIKRCLYTFPDFYWKLSACVLLTFSGGEEGIRFFTFRGTASFLTIRPTTAVSSAILNVGNENIIILQRCRFSTFATWCLSFMMCRYMRCDLVFACGLQTQFTTSRAHVW